MKLNVFKNTEKSVSLSLRQTDKDEIELITVNQDGHPINFGEILSISKSGITLYKNVDNTLGFDLDDKGRLNIKKVF